MAESTKRQSARGAREHARKDKREGPRSATSAVERDERVVAESRKRRSALGAREEALNSQKGGGCRGERRSGQELICANVDEVGTKIGKG